MNVTKISDRLIGVGQPCYIIAEAGVNHNGDIAKARRLVEIAAAAGADAVKFQTFQADALASKSAPKAEYQKKTSDADESQRDMLRRLELSPKDHLELMALCAARGILFMSSPFDEASADLLHEMGVAALKIPSGEITNLPFLAHVSAMNLPLIISTGMSNITEVETAMRIVRESGSPPVMLLHCVSAYPANAADCNLSAMATMREKFQVPVGFSDHTLGLEVGFAAVALGASIVEKHFTLDRTLPGPDHQASLTPAELHDFVRGIRSVESTIGDGRKVPTSSEKNTAAVSRKSLVAKVNIAAGERIVRDMVVARRPGIGISPVQLDQVVDRCARVDIKAEELLEWGMLK